MKVLIQFDDSNKKLAAAIGLGLMAYGDPEPAAKTTATTELEKDWSEVADEDIPVKQVFPGTEEVLEKARTAGPVKPVAQPEPDPVETITPDDTGPAMIPAGPVETDEHGTPFDAAFCGKSDKPFYAAGKRLGQWKKKRGVDQDEYDIWYDENRPAAADPEPAKVDTAAAFAGPGEAGAVTADLPATPGDLMKWCAEQTAAGNMTTAEVTAAYATCGITVADMFGADGPEHVQAILAVLVK